MFWPTIALAGFLALTGLVVALAASSTARFEFDRNLASETERAQRRTPARHGLSRHPAGRRAAAPETARAAAAEVAAPVAATSAVGWWLTGHAGQVLAGPFADRVEADWVALAGEVDDGDWEASVVYGVRRSDGSFARRSSPQELAWLTELGAQLDRLGEDWDPLLSDSDVLTTLVVEVTAALVEAGLPLHDSAAADGSALPTGGVCLTPDPTATGILVSWRQHDRMSVQQVRGPEADAAVQATMNAAVACVLAELDFEVEQFGDTGVCIVTGAGR